MRPSGFALAFALVFGCGTPEVRPEDGAATIDAALVRDAAIDGALLRDAATARDSAREIDARVIDDVGPAPDAFVCGAEVCNGLDDDCDLSIDEDVLSVFYADFDHDGHGRPGGVTACEAPPGYVMNDDDCDDGRADLHPGAVETCNGHDDDCDGHPDWPITTYCVRCASYGCGPGFECCVGLGTYACFAAGCGALSHCDGPEDCAAGERCCADGTSGGGTCVTSAAGCTTTPLCHVDGDCDPGTVCGPVSADEGIGDAACTTPP